MGNSWSAVIKTGLRWNFRRHGAAVAGLPRQRMVGVFLHLGEVLKFCSVPLSLSANHSRERCGQGCTWLSSAHDTQTQHLLSWAVRGFTLVASDGPPCAPQTWGGPGWRCAKWQRSPVQEDPEGGRNKQGLPAPILETYSLKGLESGRGKLEAVKANKRCFFWTKTHV